MKVLLVNSFYYPRGGDCVHALNLEKGLKARGHSVAVFAMQHPMNLGSVWAEHWPKYVEYGGKLGLAEQVRAGWRGVYSLEVRRKAEHLFREFRADVVHLHSVHFHLTLAVVVAAKSLGLPVVWTLHDYRTVCPATHLLRHGQLCEACRGGRYWHCVTGRCKSDSTAKSLMTTVESYMAAARGYLRKVDTYVAPSAFLGETVARMGLGAREIVVVPNAVSTQLGTFAGERSGVLYVGRLSPEKGLDVLVHALQGLTGTELHVAGDGPSRERLEALATRLGVMATFWGWVDPDRIRSLMGSAAILCVPSTCYENCPSAVLEAMSAGLPVVASDLGGLTELLEDGRCGSLVPAGDVAALRACIERALASPAELSAMARRAQVRVATRHDPELFLDHIEGIYASLAG